MTIDLIRDFIMDERFFEEQFSALKVHIDARMDGLEKRMESNEKILQKCLLKSRLSGMI
ncbi:MAG: hypothetical protein ACOYU0_09085 [Nitrospirota bacterium]